jgi:hypothetical protein
MVNGKPVNINPIVAKIFHFLATFSVHPWTFLTFHEPMPKMIDRL